MSLSNNCEYCKKIVPKFIYEESERFPIHDTSIWISRGTVHIRARRNDEQVVKLNIDINYCPMCGDELRDL